MVDRVADGGGDPDEADLGMRSMYAANTSDLLRRAERLARRLSWQREAA